MNYIEALQRRYSVKKFDKTKKVSSKTLHRILEGGQLSASSLGLQPYRILVVESEDVKQKITPAFRNPSQINTCSHLIVLATKKSIDDVYLDGYFQHISTIRETPLEDLASFKNSIKSFKVGLSEEELVHWNEKQTYILLGNLLFSSALEKVDTCPIEGFNPSFLEDLLQMDSQNYRATVTLALGYRAEDDPFQFMKKVRKPTDKLIEYY